MREYNHKKIEENWVEKWLRDNVYEAVDFSEKPKKYILEEFPYPSSNSLHAGHVMRYTVPDVYARYLRMKGYNVLFPMGWDAFGLPAENYAIKTGIHPAKITQDTIVNFKESFLRMGYGIDWEREIDTSDPNYYKWTQWLFLKFFENGLAEYKETPIWWCEELKTVLAEEEVLTDKDGNKISERGLKPVEKKMLKQWVLKIPEYAEKLLQGLDTVDFPESIKAAQRNWIGKSEGANISFEVDGESIEVFTTRPDTIFGVTFMVFAPEHPFIKKVWDKIENQSDVNDYIEASKNKSDIERQAEKDKTGVEIKGIKAKVPFAEREVPIFIADYVLMDYGTGFIMAVPAHDERDYQFAKKYGIEIIEVIKPENAESQDEVLFTGDGVMINSGEYSGVSSEEFKKIVVENLEKQGKGNSAVNYKIRDWVFSRQRYWGEPIPLIHTEEGFKAVCNTQNIKEVNENLPLELPDVPDFSPSDDGASPLERNSEWVNITYEGKPAKRETNTMPNWAGSCWYYIRYVDPKNDNEFADIEKMKYWLPVDRYFGGAEHTTLHLLYSRFWHKFFHDLNLVPTPEPYNWRINGGILLAPDGSKMSKSKDNGIDPMELVDKYGADALRTTICFMGPYDETYPYNPNIIKTVNKLIKNVYSLQEKVSDENSDEPTLKAYHSMVKNISEMIENLKMNTAVSEIMIFINHLKKVEVIGKDIWEGFLKVFSPFAPFVAEELWQEFNGFSEWKKENSMHLQPWPGFDEKFIQEETITIPVQINGKVRTEIVINCGDTEEIVKEKALSDEKVLKLTEGKEIKKFIYVKDKIVNLVL
ncbi:leucine--tRNA ligase [Patescibacteria group bacterium]|nr:leucine--tRNA ligase [Patescibacteria group bacterium]